MKDKKSIENIKNYIIILIIRIARFHTVICEKSYRIEMTLAFIRNIILEIRQSFLKYIFWGTSFLSISYDICI